MRSYEELSAIIAEVFYAFEDEFPEFMADGYSRICPDYGKVFWVILVKGKDWSSCVSTMRLFEIEVLRRMPDPGKHIFRTMWHIGINWRKPPMPHDPRRSFFRRDFGHE